MSYRPLGIALVGAGAFGEFCLAAFNEMPEVRIAAIVDTDHSRAEYFAKQYHATAYTVLDDALRDTSVDIVALNTPPFLHAEQGLAVLHAGKHLFCEKPLALTVEDGKKLLNTASASNVLLTVDYVMRHNPCWAAAHTINEAGTFGALLHMDLANHAAGLNLPDTHWFWDERKSGGIRIEHGIHFFDAFAWVAGTKGVVTSAQAFTRSGRTDRVECLARYGNAAAHFYHGFTHSSKTEQTTVMLTFERAYVTMGEWVPTSMEIHTDTEPAAFINLLPGEVTMTPLIGERIVVNSILANKSSVYRTCIQEGMRELVHAIDDRTHPLSVSGQQGIESLRMAVEAIRYTHR
jgi:predicted dehydrogenase